MAKKRAYIDATLQLAALSEIFTQDMEDLTDTIDMGEVEYTAPADRTESAKPASKPPAKQAPASEPTQDDINNVFMPDVQYRVKKAEKGTTKTTGKSYTKLLIEEAGFTLEVYDYECHDIAEGDFIIIKTMRPIKSREYNGRTYYSTSATIDIANTLTPESFNTAEAEQIPVPWDE